ncbi:putative homogentisate 1,2-dioxygenase [Rhexocercosporidium sp. MPI-PUGE-AT-0058]|nr:putative homogentisate 1,2-dioxygenase [Rhexocercosporidium sp. MPI-PUGE-AT-0058]
MSEAMSKGTKNGVPDYENIFHWAETQQDGEIPSFKLRQNDPYEYQGGFGNTFESEAVPGTIPHGQNNPRKVRFGLYTEQITGSAFVAPRSANKKAWLYRMRPAVAHRGFTSLPDNPDMESNFLPSNQRVHISPTQLAWVPGDIPSEQTTFVTGIKTMAGSGEPTLRDGLSTHIYMCNTNMETDAFVNSDGDYLIVPQEGALDIQTEFGMLYVQPGEICVIQRGHRFSIKLPDGKARGYILEIWGSSFELPELGPLGGNGMANPRDFLVPTAKYNVTTDEQWKIIYKICGKFFYSSQSHSPYDVVAWHGNYIPYKYDLTKFVTAGSISVDHIDPSIFCCLTAKSHNPHEPLADFLVLPPRWDVSSHTYRPAYYHRNAASEYMGLIYGGFGGRSEVFRPGAVSYECGMVPHGKPYEGYLAATTAAPGLVQMSKGSIAFMFESARAFTITEYAWKSDKKHQHNPELWDRVKSHFPEHQEEIEKALRGV